MDALTWARGELWPLLLLLPVLWLLLWRALAWVGRGAARYGAVGTERPRSAAQRAMLWTAAAALLLLAWMEPQLGEEKVAVERRGLDIIFCLDTSRSMLARDLQPSRLGRAKRDIVSVLPELVGGDRAGLVAFAGQARLVVPLTHDIDSFRHLLERVDTNTVRLGGTDLAAAVRAALDLAGSGAGDAEGASTTAVVLLTDGEDLTGAGRQAAAEAAAKGVVVHAVGYGSTRGSKILLEREGGEQFLRSRQGDEVVSALDTEGLRALTSATGGEFVRADVMPLPLVELKTKRMDPALERSYDAGEEVMKKSRFQWVLLPVLLLLMLEIWSNGGSPR